MLIIIPSLSIAWCNILVVDSPIQINLILLCMLRNIHIQIQSDPERVYSSSKRINPVLNGHI